MKSLLIAAIIAVAASSQAYVYLYDDGVSDTTLSTSGPPTFNVAYLTGYSIAAGGERLNSISIVWGSRFPPSFANGLTADVLLMSDPNNDGNPNDAAIIQSVTTTTTNVGTDTFNTYNLTTPVTMTVGTRFFVGAFIHDVPTGSTWCPIDTNATNQSANNWWNVAVSSPIGSYNSLSIFGSNNWDFLTRANATPVPEPLSAIALLGGLALLRRRRARS